MRWRTRASCMHARTHARCPPCPPTHPPHPYPPSPQTHPPSQCASRSRAPPMRACPAVRYSSTLLGSAGTSGGQYRSKCMPRRCHQRERAPPPRRLILSSSAARPPCSPPPPPLACESKPLPNGVLRGVGGASRSCEQGVAREARHPTHQQGNHAVVARATNLGWAAACHARPTPRPARPPPPAPLRPAGSYAQTRPCPDQQPATPACDHAALRRLRGRQQSTRVARGCVLVAVRPRSLPSNPSLLAAGMPLVPLHARAVGGRRGGGGKAEGCQAG